MRLVEYISNVISNTNEAVRSHDVEKALGLYKSYLNKKGVTVYNTPWEIKSAGSTYISVIGVNHNTNVGFICNWSVSDTAKVDNIQFFNYDVNTFANLFDGKKIKTNVTIETKGSNVMQCLKLIELGCKGNVSVSSLNKAIEKARLYESVELDELLKSKKQRPGESELDFLRRVRDNISVTISGYKKTNSPKLDSALALQQELKEKISSLSANVQAGRSFSIEVDLPEMPRATPQERFGDMYSYINSVIKGHKPLALICGAPGVGKTYRITEKVNKTHKLFDTYTIIKGRCTPQALYKTLWEYRNEDQLILFDDCDDIFRDELAVNIIKAAYDSSDKRIVSFNTAKAIVMDRELAEKNPEDAVYDDKNDVWTYPRVFEYKGGGIIITNFNAGQIDTAIRNRALIADLAFTSKELLQLVEEIMPNIMPNKLSDECKRKAFDYLMEMVEKEMPMEISIRSFCTCAIQYDCDDDEASIQRRINEQMKLQSLRGGKKY